MAQALVSTSRLLASVNADDCGNCVNFQKPEVDDAGSCRQSIIDLNGILEHRAGHDEEFLAELIFDFRSEINAQLRKIIDMISLLNEDKSDCGDFGRIERAAQSIKDASFDMLCSTLHEAAVAMELQAKEKTLKGCIRGYQNLELASKMLFEVLDSIDLSTSAWGNSCIDQGTQMVLLF